ncbi:MAG: hypothetical protein GX963_11490 [Bacteroidales bacterium]|nr:hypothetical protein [Bacteroidales bacterium]
MKCILCGIDKELTEINFHVKKKSKTGFDSRCKACRKELDRERYEKKRDKILAQKREYYQRKKKRENNHG